MFANSTRFYAFPEPELIPDPPTSTTPDTTVRDQTEAVIERIERELATREPPTLSTVPRLAWTYANFDSDPFIRKDAIWTVIPSFTKDWAQLAGPMRVLWVSKPIHVSSNIDIAALWRNVWSSGPLFTVTTDLTRENARGQTRHLDDSLKEIQVWLGIGLDSAADAVGIARGTVYAWRKRGSNPRPATVSSIMRVHGLVAAAVSAAGVERARAWFHTGDPSPLTEMIDANGDPTRLRLVSTRLRRELLRVAVPPPERGMAATVDDIIR